LFWFLDLLLYDNLIYEVYLILGPELLNLENLSLILIPSFVFAFINWFYFGVEGSIRLFVYFYLSLIFELI
jgi:hypothetical protein